MLEDETWKANGAKLKD